MKLPVSHRGQQHERLGRLEHKGSTALISDESFHVVVRVVIEVTSVDETGRVRLDEFSK